jgi:hypothetical protein
MLYLFSRSEKPRLDFFLLDENARSAKPVRHIYITGNVNASDLSETIYYMCSSTFVT